MTLPTLSVTIASVSDRDDLVAELWLDDEQVGEVLSDEEHRLSVDLYPRPGGQPWRVPLHDLIAALQEARDRLASGGPEPE